jgi:hypothetical protein
MADEFALSLGPARTGLTLSAKLLSAGAVVRTVALVAGTEDGDYTNSAAIGAISAGRYAVKVVDGDDKVYATGQIVLQADGTEIFQTGDAYARIGVAGAGLTNLGDTRLANLDAIADGTLLDNVPITAPTGPATTFREMLVQTWRRFFKASSLSATQLITYADDGTTPVTTQTVSEGNPRTHDAAT